MKFRYYAPEQLPHPQMSPSATSNWIFLSLYILGVRFLCWMDQLFSLSFYGLEGFGKNETNLLISEIFVLFLLKFRTTYIKGVADPAHQIPPFLQWLSAVFLLLSYDSPSSLPNEITFFHLRSHLVSSSLHSYAHIQHGIIVKSVPTSLLGSFIECYFEWLRMPVTVFWDM